MALKATSTSQTQCSTSSSFLGRKERVTDLVVRRTSPKQQRAPAQYQRDRWILGSSFSEDADDEKDDEKDEKDDDDDRTDKETGSSSTLSRIYLIFNLEDKTRWLRQGSAEKIARRRKLQKQQKERERRRQKQKRHEQKRQRRRRMILEKNDEIMEWRDTFEVGEIPKGIEKQFPERSRVAGPWEHRWLVSARTSRTMLECA